MVRLSTLYSNFPQFLRVANHIQGILTQLRDKARDEVERTAYIYLQNRITEAVDRVHMGLLFDSTGLNPHITDLDYIVTVDGKVRAIIEQKRRRFLNGHIKVNRKQYEVLHCLARKLDIPVYYLVKTWNGGFKFYFVPLRFWRSEVSGNGQTKDDYALIPLSQGVECDAARLVEVLAEILG